MAELWCPAIVSFGSSILQYQQLLPPPMVHLPYCILHILHHPALAISLAPSHTAVHKQLLLAPLCIQFNSSYATQANVPPCHASSSHQPIQQFDSITTPCADHMFLQSLIMRTCARCVLNYPVCDLGLPVQPSSCSPKNTMFSVS